MAFCPNSGIYEIAVMAEKLQESVYQIYAEVFHQIVHILKCTIGNYRYVKLWTIPQ